VLSRYYYCLRKIIEKRSTKLNIIPLEIDLFLCPCSSIQWLIAKEIKPMHIVRGDQKAKSMPKPRDVKESSQWRRYAGRRNIIILYSLSFFNLVLFSLMKGILSILPVMRKIQY
jgi:hypothetical protein